MNVLLYIIAFVVIVLTSVFVYCKWVYTYWKRHGVPYMEPSFPFGTVKELVTLKLSMGELSTKQYKFAKSKGYKHLGLFGFFQPEYMPIDPEIIKRILVKDFNHFTDRGLYSNEKDDPLSGNMFLLEGDRWKQLRAKLSPTFTSGKIKMMFPIVTECTDQLKNALDVHCEQGPVDVKHFLECFGLNVIGSCAFGLNCDSFNGSDSDFYKYSKRSFEPTNFQNFKLVLSLSFSSILRFFGMTITPADISSFFMGIVRDTIEYRNANNVVRHDFLEILINLMKETSGLTVNEVAAQVFLFFLAGFETSSTAMMYSLLELALHQDVQEKLRKEVNEVMARHTHLTYEALKEMSYMNQVLDEAMRKYPPFPILNRICTRDYKVPSSNFTLKKGTRVTIPLWGIQKDPDYFPEPEKFDPDRFTPGNKEKISQFWYMPFGEGPRLCIGLRFAQMQMKIALAMMMTNYKFSVNEKTQLPLKLKPKSLIITPVGSIWLNVEKI